MKKILAFFLLAAAVAGWGQAFGATWAFVNTGAVVGAGSTNTVPLNVAYPASVVSGNILLLKVHDESGAATITPTGITTSVALRTTNGVDQVFCKVADGSESGNLTVSGSTTNRVIAQVAQFSGGTCTVITSATGGSSATTGLPYTGLTIAENSALVVLSGGKSINVTSYSPPAGFTNIGQGNSSTLVSMTWDYQIQTNAASIASGVWGITGDQVGGRSSVSVALSASTPALAPTFTSGPSIGTPTTTTIPVVFTLDKTGTVYGILQAAGAAAPTCTQVKAGQNGGGTAAIASWSQAVTATVQATQTFTGLSAGPYDGYYCENDTTQDSLVKSTLGAAKVPVLTVGPTFAAGIGGGTLTFTGDSVGTVHCIARGALTAPFTGAVVVAHTGARASGSKAVAASVSNTVTLTGLTLPLNDYDCAETNAGGTSAAATANDQLSSAPSGKTFAQLASISTSTVSLCLAFNAISTPAIAIGDVVEMDANTPRGKAITQATDCTAKFDSNGLRELICYRVYDASLDAWMIGGGTPCGTGYGNLWVNNVSPDCPPHLRIFVPYSKTFSFDFTGTCTDFEGDTMNYTAIDPVPPFGVVTNNVLGGIIVLRGRFTNRAFQACDMTGACTNF